MVHEEKERKLLTLLEMAQTLLYIIVAILVVDFILERVLDWLNSTYWSDELPAELEGIYDAEEYKRSQQYLKVNHRFSMVTSSLNFVLVLAMVLFGGFALVDQWARQLTSDPILMALIFFGILGLAADLLGTPFSAYATFVIEERFGFNTTTVKTFILDKLKGWGMGIIIGGGLLALIVWIYTIAGEWFWLIAWGAISGFSIFMSMFYSDLIVPLFNKQTPLEEGELRDAIEAYAASVGFQLRDIYVIDSSKRSTKGNAYFTGFGPKKRIVLYDTLIRDHSTDELVAVLAHEVGHYKKKHTLLGMVLSVLHTGIMLFILSLVIDSPVLSQALGAGEPSFHMGLVAFGVLYAPLSSILGLLMNMLSRRHEYAADRFAGETYRAGSLSAALKKLSVKNLSNLRPHPAYVFVHYSHPPLLKRLEALARLGG